MGGGLTVIEQIDEKYQEDLERIRGFRLIDDDFMTICFENEPKCIGLVLQIVLDQPTLEIKDVRTQVFVENLRNHSVRFDVLAINITGIRYNCEIQRSDKGAGRKRARYHSSMMDINLLKKSEDFDKLSETYVVFITENDVLRQGKPVYHIERYIQETGELFHDGSHILYVNGAYRDDTAIGKLMHDFFCTNPDDMYYDVLADRVRFFKESKKGVAIMCKVIEEMRMESFEAGKMEGKIEGKMEGRMEGIKLIAQNMLETGRYALEEISKLSGLSLEEVEALEGKWK